MEEQQPPTTDYLRLLRRVAVHRWRLVLACFLLVLLPTVGLVYFLSENMYEASATLFLIPEKSGPQFLREFSTSEANALYAVLLRSRSLAQAVIEALPRASRDELSTRVLLRDYVLLVTNQIRRLTGHEVIVYSPTELAIRELQEARMRFNVAKDGTVTVTALAFSPRVAVDLANTYVDVLLSRSSQFSRQQARGTRELLETVLTQAKQDQADAEEALRAFQAKGGANLKLPEEARPDLAALTQLEIQMADVQVSREVARQKLAYLKGDRTKAPPAGSTTDPATEALRERLTELQTKLAALQEKYTDQHPLVQAAKTEIDEAQDRLKAALRPQQSPKPTGATAPLKPIESAQLSKQMADLEVELLGLRAREQNLQQRISRVKQSLSAMNARQLEYSNLARNVESQSKLAGILAEKLNAARIVEQNQIRAIQVVDLASLPRQPSPKRPLTLLLFGLLGGLGLGIGVGMLRERASQVVETDQDVVRTTGLAVLGSIPTAEVVKPVPGQEQAPVIFLATGDPHSLPADACRAIRTAIDCHSLDQPIRTLLVTSAGASEGKSTVVLNLGRAYVESDRRVLIIDADLRRPALHRALKMPNEGGLADMLREGAVWPEGFRGIAPGFDFLPSGIKPANPSSLLASKHMAKILDLAREKAEVVLIDAPPALAVSDCLPLCRQVDGVILVSRFGRTHQNSLLRAKEQLQKAGASIVGVVVNGLSPRETRRYYAEYDHYVGRKKKAASKRKARS